MAKSHPGFSDQCEFSPVQFREKRVVQDVLEVLQASGLPGQALTLEITESTRLDQFESYRAILKEWAEAGIAVSLDDFGTGYANIGYLNQLEVDEIKIDRLFVSGLQEDTYNYRLISNVIDFARRKDIRICCEGVENDQERLVLEGLSPDLMQGYLFARPCSRDDFEKIFIRTQTKNEF